MSGSYSLIGGVWQSLIDFITGIFALIPQFLYFIYTCCASLLDLIQFVVRKVAGLDVYYIDGKPTSGDIVSDFISGVLGINHDPGRYSALSTVFWSLVIFGCIVLVLSTIFSIIKNQYTYDAQKSHPMTIIFSSIKTLFLMAIIPLTCVFGIYLSNILLRTVDTITSPASTTQIADVYKNSSENYTLIFEKGTTSTGEEAYSSYDFFGSRAYTNSTTFSGVMFKISTKNANRVRYGSYTPSEDSTMNTSGFLWSDFGIFTSKSSDEDIRREEVADMIDFAFANCLTLQNKDISASLLGKESAPLISSFTYLESAVWYLGLIDVSCFSKYNVGLVWYYYNLWSFNFFLGYAGMAACMVIFSSVFFGLVQRFVNLMAMFLVFPTLVGIGPLDGNAAIGKWQKEFLKNVLTAYGAVVGLNLAFLLLGEMQKIYFFSSAILNDIMDMALIIVVLAVIKDLIKFMSAFIGGGDASENSVKEDFKKAGTEALSKTLKAADLALKIGAVTPAGKAAKVAVTAAKKGLSSMGDKIKAKAGNAQPGDHSSEIGSLSKDQEKLEKQRDAEQKLSNNDAKAFEEMLKKNKGKERSQGKTAAKKFATDKGQSSAESIYSKFAGDYEKGSRNIDRDSSLSRDQKAAKKGELWNSLASEAIRDFSENNEHAVNAKEFESEAIEKEIARKDLERQDKEAKANYNKARKANRSPIVKAMLDIGGQTLKAVGTITGIADGWSKMKKDSSVGDDLNKVVQSFFQAVGAEGQLKKVKDGSSKFLTQKQKDDREKDAARKYREDLAEFANQSERFKREIQNLSAEYGKYVDRENERRRARERIAREAASERSAAASASAPRRDRTRLSERDRVDGKKILSDQTRQREIINNLNKAGKAKDALKVQQAFNMKDARLIIKALKEAGEYDLAAKVEYAAKSGD